MKLQRDTTTSNVPALATIPAPSPTAASTVAATAASAPPALVSPSSITPSSLKKFTLAQIQQKVAQRSSSVPEYEQLLMQSQVRTDADGIVFDSQHTAWQQLLHLCTIADTLEKQEQQRIALRIAEGEPAEARTTPIQVYAKDFPLPSQKLSASPLPPPAPSQLQMPLPTPTSATTTTASQPMSIPSKSRVNAATLGSPLRVGMSTSPRTDTTNATANRRHASHATLPSPALSSQQHSAQASDDTNGDEWVDVRAVSLPKRGATLSPPSAAASGESPKLASALGAALFSQATMMKAANALDRFSKAITARPTAPSNRAGTMRASTSQQHAHPSKQQHSSHSSKSSSNSSRDTNLVKEDLEFEAMLQKEFEAAAEEQKQKAEATHAENTTVGVAGTIASASVQEASADSTSSKDSSPSKPSASTSLSAPSLPPRPDADTLARFLYLISPAGIAANGAEPDVAAIKAACKVIGVPHRHRGQLWRVMLGVSERRASLMDSCSTDSSNNNTAAASEPNSAVSRQSRLQTVDTIQPHVWEHTSEDDSHSNGPLRPPIVNETEPSTAADNSVTTDSSTAQSSTTPSLTDSAIDALTLDPAAAFVAAASTGSTAAAVALASVLSPPPSTRASALSSAPAAASTPSSTTPLSSPTAPKFDLYNQRVVRADIERTLPHLRTFQSPKVRHDMEVILTSYCKNHTVSYKQGLNYVLAPFFLLNLPTRDDTYSLFEAFIAKLLPSTFVDSEFGSLQCIFVLFKLALRYHDPLLATFLEEHDLGPELYASSWFITLFSNRCKLSVLYYLFDVLILDCRNDPHLNFWVSLALLIHHRETLLAEQIVVLPEVLSKLTIPSKKDAALLANRAKKLYRAHSSETTRQQLKDISERNIKLDSAEYARLAAQTTLLVDVAELLKSCYGDVKRRNSTPTADTPARKGNESSKDDTSTTGSAAATAHPSSSSSSSASAPLKYFIIDCRSPSQFAAGHLPCAFNLDPSLLARATDLADVIEDLSSMKGSHICFLGEGGEPPATVASTAAQAATVNPSMYAGKEITSPSLSGISSTPPSNSAAVKAIMQQFIHRGFRYVSYCPDGYAACHALVLASDHRMELIDHSSEECYECSGRKVGNAKTTKKQAGGWLNRLLRPQRDAAAALLGRENTAEYQAAHTPDSAVVLLSTGSAASASPSPLSPSAAPSTFTIRLLHTVIRDKSSDVSSFADALARLTSIVVHSFFERIESYREKHVNSGVGSMYTGIEAPPVCTIATSAIAMELLDQAFHPFARTVCKRVTATYQFEVIKELQVQSIAGNSSDAAVVVPRRPSSILTSIQVPPNLLECHIFLFYPLLTPDELPGLFDILADLCHSRNAVISQIVVCSVIVARPVLWKLWELYPDLLTISSCVDEWTAQNRLLPGVFNLEERYQASK